jgi:D-3-phosphoglycerate dehydrogenase / 2-oxoglutarate reductase
VKIAVLDDFQQVFRTLDCYPGLEGHDIVTFDDSVKDPVALAERLQGFDAVVLTQQRTALTRATIERLDRLVLVAQTGYHTTHIDLAACTEHGILVSGASAGPSIATAELTWALILAARRHIVEEVQSLKQGRWQSRLGNGLFGRTLGIYAFGKTGAMVAPVGRAFGMRVVCWGRSGSLARAAEAGYEIAQSRVSFFAESDIVTLHLPLNGETRGIVTAADLALMKPSALIVNTSRSGIIAPGALIQALEAGRPGQAAVDVYDEEPVSDPASEKLLSMANVLCTPHLGYVERANYEKLFGGVVKSILAFAAGSPVDIANPDVVPIAAAKHKPG